MKYSNELLLLGKEAKEAAKVLSSLDSEDRNRSLYKIAENLIVNKEQILIANKKDCEEAISNRLDDSLIDRIYLDDKRLSDISKDVITIAELPDPLDEIFDMKSLPTFNATSATLGLSSILLRTMGRIFVTKYGSTSRKLLIVSNSSSLFIRASVGVFL